MEKDQFSSSRPEKEKAILVGTFSSRLKTDLDTPAVEDSLEELAQLTQTARAEVLERVTARLDRVNPRTFINSGKIAEVKALVEALCANLVVFDDSLSPSQNKNLESELGVRVIDRRALILDIFAQRAQTAEGKLQVELAQLIYLMPRLTRMWTHLERQKGGIGLRGPGETQLEIDRRLIRNRIGRLKDELKKVQNSRKIQREKRRSVPVPQAILVGYTNSGKSTLFNQLTEAGVLAADKLFATLDPTTRRIELPGHFEVLLTDSVGFIRKLPTELVEAFKATLEEVQNAELLLHVVDCSDPLWESQKRATEKVLEELDCLNKPTLEVYNKIDRLPHNDFGIAQSPRRVFVSALQSLNLDKLREKMADLLGHGRERVRLVLPQGRGDLLALAFREGHVLTQNFESDRMELTVELPKKRIEQWKKEGFVVLDS